MHVDAPQQSHSTKRPYGMTSAPEDAPDYDRLIQAVALNRDRDAFAQLFEHFAPRLKAWLVKAGASDSAAEDFAQDTMLTVWRKADLFDPRKARASTWIFTIARNRRLDSLRRDTRAAAVPEIDPIPPEVPQPDSLLLMAEDARRVHDALSQLKPQQVEILRMSYFAENPHTEIAAHLQIPLGTVKSRIRNAMQKLRTILENNGEQSL